MCSIRAVAPWDVDTKISEALAGLLRLDDPDIESKISEEQAARLRRALRIPEVVVLRGDLDQASANGPDGDPNPYRLTDAQLQQMRANLRLEDFGPRTYYGLFVYL